MVYVVVVVVVVVVVSSFFILCVEEMSQHRLNSHLELVSYGIASNF